MAEVTPAAPAPAVAAVPADIAKLKADLAALEAKVSAADATATSWLAAHAHQFVTGVLVVAVLYILHKIL